MIILSFAVCLFLFVIIGVLSSIQSKNTNKDYLLAGRDVKPWLVSLSAVATTNSGYMFVGMIGYTYMVGLSTIWLMLGWVIGDFISSLFIHKNLRTVSEKQKALSFAGVLSKWNGTDYRKLRFLGGIVTVLLLGTYAAAQLNAGSKALHVLFGWDYSVGAIIGAIMVLLYCFAGGIRASIWTDAAQSFVMIIAMALLFFTALDEIGGFTKFTKLLDSISPNYLDLFPQNLPFGKLGGPFLFVIGWLFGGFGVVGQPHIMVRFMTMDKISDMNRVRAYYYGWYSTFYALTICTGLAARAIIPDVGNFDVELVLPTLAQKLLPEILVGLILAGLFAATMSTADSQILSCSAAITHDFMPNKKSNYLITKLGTVFVTTTALMIALFGSNSVFALVMIAWSALGSAFAPLLTVYSLKRKVSENVAISMMLSGLIVMIIWKYLGLDRIIYEVAPGMLAGFIPYFLAKATSRNK